MRSIESRTPFLGGDARCLEQAGIDPSRPRSALGRGVPPGFSRSVVLPLAILLLGLHPTRSRALDGVVNGRSSVQEGRAGAETYRQVSTETEVNASQYLRLAGGFQVGLDGRAQRELFRSRLGATRNNFDRRTRQADAFLDHNGRLGGFRLGALAFDQKTLGAGAEVPRLKRGQLETSAAYGRGRTRVSASGLFLASRREFHLADPLRDEEWSGSFELRSGIPRVGALGYRFSTLTDRNLNLESRSTRSTQTITFDGSSRFGGGRGLVALRTTSGFFTQTQTREMGGVGVRLVLPHAAGFLLDDSPELHDPLEAEMTPAVALYDGDRQIATMVQIGDSAPAVREFGGDYRNIVFDFGEAVEPDSAVIYVDHTIVSPEMLRWQVFISNDPEGRRWEEASGAGVAYAEWGVGLQGWTVVFSQPVSARFLKMVDVKLGPTTADLSVTELEVFTRVDQVTDRDRSDTTNHRVGLSLGYQLFSGVRASYDLSYRRRTLTGQPGVLEDLGQGFTTSWSRGIWAVSGHYEVRALEGRQSRDTRASTQTVTLKRSQSKDLVSTLSWSRVHDQSVGVEKISNSLSLASNWNAAPALRLSQRVIGAQLTDHAANRTATSLGVVTSVIGEPTGTISLDLEESERWASQEAGTGFSRFGDTSFILRWRPVPLISLESMTRYQMRGTGHWLTRNSITWELLSGGDLTAGLSAQQFRDTRARETQQSGGVQFEWAARPSLTIRGNVQTVALKAAQQKNSPLNAEIRGTWRY
jgi:hypothetical protein